MAYACGSISTISGIDWGKEKDAIVGGALGSHVSKTDLLKEMVKIEKRKRLRQYGRKVA
jgi:hypothetical protein